MSERLKNIIVCAALHFSLCVTLVLGFMSFPSEARGQTVQSGVVREYKEKAKKTPLAGVELDVRHASNAVSGKDGGFRLQFNTLKPGERVTVRSVSKPGYEIFNKDALDQWNINAGVPFEIVMCRSDRFKKIRDNYMKVSSESYARQLKKDEAALSRLKAENKLREEEYQQRLAELRENYECQLDNLENYIDRFSRIDLSEISKSEQEILGMVSEGNIEEAIAAYDGMDFIGKYQEGMLRLKEAEAAEQKLNELVARKRDECNELKSSVARQVQTLRLAGGQKNQERIGELLRMVADADTTDAAAALEFAHFISLQRDTPLSREYLRRALRHGDEEERFIARMELETDKILSEPVDSATVGYILGSLDSRYCRERPFLRLQYVSLIVLACSQGDEPYEEITVVPKSTINGFIKEIDSFRPVSRSDWLAKIFAESCKQRFFMQKGLYKSRDEYEDDVKALIRLYDDYEGKYGFGGEVCMMVLSSIHGYLLDLLQGGDLPTFDALFPRYYEYACGLFHNDPVQYRDVYYLYTTQRLKRELARPGGGDFSRIYLDHLKDLERSIRTTDMHKVMMLTQCADFVMDKSGRGLPDPADPAHIFFSVFPPERYTLDFMKELVGSIAVLTVSFEGESRLLETEKVLDAYLNVSPGLQVVRLAKGEIRLRLNDEPGARAQLETLMRLNPGKDFTKTSLYKHFNTNN